MSLSPGTRFGIYEVQAPIGAGGMGEVYLARDTRLGRDVALKVLPDGFARDADRVARFRREAQMLAALNDSSIAQIYGVEEHDGTTAIAMEFVAGRTLAERLARGPLPPDEALSLGRKIALALEAAHRAGIAHRDLKPANVKDTDDDAVKVLDFGLARSVDPAPPTEAGDAPTVTSPAPTVAGVILGTAAYMAPEQARGRPIDKRADIWAFGCVLYEMLTGRRPFAGDDVSEVLAAVIKSEPDWSRLPGLPPVVAAFLRRCLAKDPRERVHDIADVRLALEGAFDAAPSPAPEARPRLSWKHAAATATLGAVLAGLVAWILWPAVESPVTRLDFAAGGTNLAVAPDGGSVVVATREALYIRPIDQLDARAIPGTPRAASPFFSPDGRTVGYWSRESRQLKRTDANGGATIVIAPSSSPRGASWTHDDMIIYGQSDGVWRVPAAGGTPEHLLPLDDEDLFGPQLLPDGDSILVTVTDTPNWSRAEIVVVSMTTQQRTVVVSEGRSARYLPTGHLVYGVGDVLYAAPFNPETFAIVGPAVPVVRGVHTWAGRMHYAVSPDGTLAYTVARTPNRVLTWVDRQGGEMPIGMPPGAFAYARLSPSGRRIAIDERDDDNGISIWDLDTQTPTRLTVGEAGGWFPVWSVDGGRVAYQAPGRDLSWKAADNTGTSEVLIDASAVGGSPSPLHFFEDGTLLFRHPAGIWIRRPGADPVELLDESTPASTVVEPNAEPSPNGRWLAYQSDESGVYQVYVRPFPNVADRRVQVSNAGGVMPRWSSDGELLYVEPEDPDDPLGAGRMMSVRVDSGPLVPAIQSRTRLFDLPRSAVVMRTWDLSSDGQRFLVIRDADDAPPRIVVVQNWFRELSRLVPAAR